MLNDFTSACNIKRSYFNTYNQNSIEYYNLEENFISFGC